MGLTNLLASLHCSSEGRSILDIWGVDRLKPVNDAFYDPIRHMARIALGAEATERKPMPAAGVMPAS